jgi:WD repeat-containing protein 61
MNIVVEKKHSFVGHSGSIYTLCKSNSSAIIYSGSSDKMIASWNIEKSESSTFAASFPSPVYSIVQEQNFLIVGTGAGSIHVLDLENKSELKVLQLHSAQVFDLQIARKHQFIISAGGDGQIAITDLMNFEFIKSGKLCNEKVRAVSINANETMAAVACGDGTIRLFDLPETNELLNFKAHNLSANCVAWSPDGKYLISGGRDAYLRVWQVEKQFELLTAIPAHNYALYKIAFSPDGKLFATASRDKTIKIWDSENFQFLLRINEEKFSGHINSVNALLWNEHGLISAGDDRSILCWEVK